MSAIYSSGVMPRVLNTADGGTGWPTQNRCSRATRGALVDMQAELEQVCRWKAVEGYSNTAVSDMSWSWSR
jgi:hypothetical protein